MTVSSHAFQEYQEHLASLVGGQVRLGEPGDMIAGVQPQAVVEPANEQEVAAVMAFANREGLKVCVRGGGTQLNMGKPPRECDLLLSTARLNQVLEYQPHDMTVSVQAGLRLADLQAHLRSGKQWLAQDAPLEPEATIGGIISTNVSGPRRLRFGGVRDQIIGIRVVLPDGTIAKGGGKVVKNVAGYDLPKLYTGALGTLGVIVAATFRLYPLRAASRTILLSAPSPKPLCELVVHIIGSTLEPTALDVSSDPAQDGTCILAVRFETEPEPVAEQAASLLKMAGTLAEHAQSLEGEAEAALWQQSAQQVIAPHDDDKALILKASLLPTDIATWLERFQQLTQQAQLATQWRAHAGHGLLFARLSGEQEALVTAVQQLREEAMAHKGSLVVTQAAPTLAQALDVWGPIPALEVMRNLKTRFDPNYIMNPGRFVGGL
jgi:glycolate oxidase FAD binding subunit